MDTRPDRPTLRNPRREARRRALGGRRCWEQRLRTQSLAAARLGVRRRTWPRGSELGLDSPPQLQRGRGRRGEAGEEREVGVGTRPQPGRPCAAAGPGTPLPGGLDRYPSRAQNARPSFDSKAQNSPLHSIPVPESTDPAASPPSPPLKGQRISNFAYRGRGVGTLRSRGSTDSGRARRESGGVSVTEWTGPGDTRLHLVAAFPSHTPVLHSHVPPFLGLTLPLPLDLPPASLFLSLQPSSCCLSVAVRVSSSLALATLTWGVGGQGPGARVAGSLQPRRMCALLGLFNSRICTNLQSISASAQE
ncbi:hypothetical protein P7K49_011980 [Saguinus oedipus]|uniref:Uncharacterized protein n=1 Tax=Saguinus oedipus TaxID=9490 RepID=A0ABQ9VS77_SAGOE|nr:hypothetical protein P7K49_011980 [Saguinus oedipus]